MSTTEEVHRKVIMQAINAAVGDRSLSREDVAALLEEVAEHCSAQVEAIDEELQAEEGDA